MKPEDAGLCSIDGKRYYFTEARPLRADAKGGEIEITLTNGSKRRVYAAQILRHPSGSNHQGELFKKTEDTKP